MKKYYFYLPILIFMLVVGSTSLLSCSDDDETLSQASILQMAEGIIELKSGIGNWDAAYLTKVGYFCYNEDINGITDTTGTTESGYSSMTYMLADGSEIVSLISTKSDKIPTQLVTKRGIVYFSFPNDSILELLYDDGKTVVMLDSIAYAKNDLQNLQYNSADAFKSTLSAAAFLLNKNQTKNKQGKTIIDTYGKIFDEVSCEPYVQDDELVSYITTDETGNYEFAETINEWYGDEIGEYVCNTLSLWTGKATYKVGGSSCTLSATIFCPSDIYNVYGIYGIICDEEQSKLIVGQAEYEGVGFQSENDLSYSVDFRGLKPNTTYYYKAYYKFNSSDHGNIVPKYGEPTEQIFYDTTVKSFKTGDNVLNVDVVMCIDVTGSMSGVIGTVKRNAMAFYDLFNKCCEEEGIQLIGLNSQVVAFQDVNVDGDRWMNVSPTYSLPSQKNEFNSFVNSLYADWGGDVPESGLEALDKAFCKTDWGKDDGYHRQVIILWTDAPYLTGAYSGITTDELKVKWDSMPSGRRLILFAPYGNDYSNGGDWGVFDSWKNVIHDSDLYSGFDDFDYVLKSIIGELTGKAKMRKTMPVDNKKVYFRPNR